MKRYIPSVSLPAIVGGVLSDVVSVENSTVFGGCGATSGNVGRTGAVWFLHGVGFGSGGYLSTKHYLVALSYKKTAFTLRS
jgi:hypothetical protein